MNIQNTSHYRPRFTIPDLKKKITNENLKEKITNEKIEQLNSNIIEFNKDISSELTVIPKDFYSLEKILAELSQETAAILNNDTELTEKKKIYFSKILIDAYLICKCNKKEDKSLSRSQRFYYEENTLKIKGNQIVHQKKSILSGYFKDAIILYNSIYRPQNIKEPNSIISLEDEIKSKINITQCEQNSDNKENTPPPQRCSV